MSPSLLKLKIKKIVKKLNHFLLLAQVLMKLQWFRHIGSDYFPWLFLLKFPLWKKVISKQLIEIWPLWTFCSAINHHSWLKRKKKIRELSNFNEIFSVVLLLNEFCYASIILLGHLKRVNLKFALDFDLLYRLNLNDVIE